MKFIVKVALLFLIVNTSYGQFWRDSSTVMIPSPAGKKVAISQFKVGDTTWRVAGGLAVNGNYLMYSNGSMWFVVATSISGAVGNSDSLGNLPASSYQLKADSTIVSAGYGASVTQSNHTATVSVDSSVIMTKGTSQVITAPKYSTARQYMTSIGTDTLQSYTPSSPFVVNDSLKVTGDYLQSDTTNYLTDQFHVAKSSGVSASFLSNGATALSLYQYGTGTDGADFNLFKARQTRGTPLVINANDQLGTLRGFGYDGSSFIEGARIRFFADSVIGTNDMPTRITFWTTPNSSSTITERMRIDNAGRVSINSAPSSTSVYVPTAQFTLSNSANANIFEAYGDGSVLKTAIDSTGRIRIALNTTASLSGLQITNSGTGTSVSSRMEFVNNAGTTAQIGLASSGYNNTSYPALRATKPLFLYSPSTGLGFVADGGGAMYFQTSNGASSLKMMLNNSGDLFLGDTTITTARFVVKNRLLADALKIYNSRGTLIADVDSVGSAMFTGLQLGITTKTTNYTATASDYTILVSCSSANITITLPSAVTNFGRLFNIKKIDNTGYSVIIATTSSQTIDGYTNITFDSKNTVYSLQSDGANYQIVH